MGSVAVMRSPRVASAINAEFVGPNQDQKHVAFAQHEAKPQGDTQNSQNLVLLPMEEYSGNLSNLAS